MLFSGYSLVEIVILTVVLLFCMTMHELSHGFVAYLLNDNTAKNMGRLTLNPIKHIDPIGLLLLLTARFGWAKPVPINMANFKDPKKGMAISALAGPFSNFLLALIFALVYVFFGKHTTYLNNEYINDILSALIWYNSMFAVFNLIPIPPLDGSKIIFAILPNRMYYKLLMYEHYGMLALILLLYTGVGTSFLSNGITNMIETLQNLANYIIR